MRVTSEFFVSSLVRRAFGDGVFAAATRKGAAEAGAVFVILDRLDGTFDFYAPAPQVMVADPADGRLFEKVLAGGQREEIDRRLAAEARMDPDFWVVEIESRDGQVKLPVAPEETAARPADAFFKF